MHGQRADSGDSDQLRTLRLTIEGLKSEVETLKFNSGVNPSTFETFARDFKEALVRDKLNSEGELREIWRRVAALELHSASVEGHQALDIGEMREERLKRLEVHSRELKGEMQDFKEHFTRTEEAIKTDINTIRHSLASSSNLPSLEALVRTRPVNPISPAEHPLVEVPQHPHKICSYHYSKSNLYCIDMQTGEEQAHTLPNYTFQGYPSMCERPDNLLFITGGRTGGQEVVSVQMDSLALKNCPNMLTSRSLHGSAYFGGFLYVIGGEETKFCERYDMRRQTWTAIPPLPTTATNYYRSGVVVSCDKLYCLGGTTDRYNGSAASRDAILTLSLESLSWSTLAVKLPSIACDMACFTKDSEVYFVLSSKLYRLTQDNRITQVCTLSANIQSHFGPSYYSGRSIYSTSSEGKPYKVDVRGVL
jgi:hypothetical protein